VPKTNVAHQLLMAFSPAMALINKVVTLLISFDPMDKWVVKPLFGDWGELTAAAQAWRNSSGSVQVLVQNLESVGARVGEEWEGDAAEAFLARLEEFVQVMESYPQAVEDLAEYLDLMVETMQVFTDVVAEAIAVISSIAQILIDELCVPLAGPELAAGTAAANSSRVIGVISKVNDAMKTVNFVASQALTIWSMIEIIIRQPEVVRTLNNLHEDESAASFRANAEGFDPSLGVI
jgi:WXG100 family type VII secretion target